MRETVPDPLLATQTERRPTHTSVGASPTRIHPTRPEPGSMRATESREDAVTHTLPAPAAMPFAAPSTAIERSTRAVRESILNTDPP